MAPKVNCILLIDDDSVTNLMNKVLIDELNCCNYIIKKDTAVRGLTYLTESADSGNNLPFPTLIFLDIKMPEQSGWDFLLQYEQIKHTLPIKPVIYMLSGYLLSQNIMDLAKSDALNGLCEKPLTAEMVKSILNKNFVLA